MLSSPVKSTEQEFVFGEKLSDRVINVESPKNDEALSKAGSSSATSDLTKKNECVNLDNGQTKLKSDSVLNSTNEDSSLVLNNYENDNEHESAILKLNCKLYLLDIDKKNWLERGYGILKIFETNDRSNYKMSK